jgi:hypothetical protein
MHGLNTIYSLNEEAVRFEYDRKLKDLKNKGLIVVWKQDDLGLCDITVPPLGFETVALAQQSVLGKEGNWQILK